MKNIRKYFGLTLIALLFSVVFSACEDKDEVGSENIGLGIKVFSPTKVVTGQPVTINGSGLGDVKEVVFPGGIAVTNIEHVSNEMIRVITPAGINIPAEGENLKVRTADAEAVSPRVMTQGNTQLKPKDTFSVEANETVKAKSILTIFGQDMEFVNRVEFVDKEDNPIILGPADFYRIATNSLAIKIPADVKEGEAVYSFYTYDGKKFDLPNYKYEAAAAGGHIEIKKVLIWENEGSGAISWSSTYRFCLEGKDSNNECLAEFDADAWEIIKNGNFKVDIEATDPQIRVTTGWWDPNWGDDIFPGNELLVDNGDGTMTLSLNLSGSDTGAAIDDRHLLLTGDRYTPIRIYYEVEEWVEEEEGHWERLYIWKNEGSGAISWSSTYRFCLEGKDSNNECLAEFDADAWEIIKNGDFKVDIEATDPQIRVTTGWWDPNWGDDIFPGNELLVDNGDGTMTLSLNLSGSDTGAAIDDRHLLLTGDRYTPISIYVDVWVSGSAPKEVVFWENEGSGAISWSSTYRFCLEGKDSNKECLAEFDADTWEKIKNETVYLDIEATDPQIRVTTGWWDPNWGDDIFPGNELLVDNGDGTMTLSFNLKGSDTSAALDDRHLLLTGDRYTPLRLYFK